MNITNYLKWRGDLSFSKDPFNPIDNVILSFISYSNIDGAFINKDVITLKEASDFRFSSQSEDETVNPYSFIKEAPMVLKMAAQTKRFAGIRIHDYVKKTQKDNTKQFGATMFDITKDVSYVAFRGTDDTLIGWKEDFQMTYRIVESQMEAVSYLNKHCKAQRKYIVGGHSKGGNLALYGVMFANKTVKERILQVFNNDGPGIRDEFFDEKKFAEIKDRYIKIVPETDFFGSVLKDTDDRIIVKSDAFGLVQHSCFTWQLEGKQFVLSNENSEAFSLLSESFNRFVSETPKDLLELFTTELFEAMDNAKIETIPQLIGGGVKALIGAVRQVSQMDPACSQVAENLIKIIAKDVQEEIVSDIENRISEIVPIKDLKDEVSEATRKIRKDISVRVKKKKPNPDPHI